MNPLSHINQTSLCKHLKDHEDDIARGVNDFGELRGVFHAMFQRNAKCSARNPVGVFNPDKSWFNDL